MMIYVVSWKEKMKQKVILSLSESEFQLDSSSSGAYEFSDEELSDSVSLDNSLQNISSRTPQHHFQWAKWDDNQADEDAWETFIF